MQSIHYVLQVYIFRKIKKFIAFTVKQM